jgi:hypothetical protein
MGSRLGLAKLVSLVSAPRLATLVSGRGNGTGRPVFRPGWPCRWRSWVA